MSIETLILDEFKLSELSTPLKYVGIYLAGTYIVGFIIAIIVFNLIGIVGFNIYKQATRQLNDNNFTTSNKESFFTNVSELTNDDYEDLENDSNTEISKRAEGDNNTDHSYLMDGSPKREVVYIVSKKNSNYIVSVYKTYFNDFFNKTDRHTVFVTIVYENIKIDDFDKFKNPQIKAPEFYLKSDNTCYTYGYASIDDIYNNILKPLENDYKISKK